MDAVANLKQHWKPAVIVLGVGALFYVGFKLIGAGGGAPQPSAIGTASGTDAAAILAQQSGAMEALRAQTTVAMAQLDNTSFNQVTAAKAQVGAVAINSLANLQLANTQALATGFSNFVVGTANEVASTASAAGNLGAANSRAVAANITAFAQLLASAGSLVGGGGVLGSAGMLMGAAGGTAGGGMTRYNGLPSTGFTALQGSGLPIIMVPTNSGFVR